MADDIERNNTEPYRITYFDPVAAESEETLEAPEPAADGGHHESTFSLALETRERVAAMETSVNGVRESVERIEEKVDEVADHAESVEDDSLSADRFERDYEHKITSNHRVTTILKWLAGTTVTTGTVAGVLLEIGVV